MAARVDTSVEGGTDDGGKLSCTQENLGFSEHLATYHVDKLWEKTTEESSYAKLISVSCKCLIIV